MLFIAIVAGACCGFGVAAIVSQALGWAGEARLPALTSDAQIRREVDRG